MRTFERLSLALVILVGALVASAQTEESEAAAVLEEVVQVLNDAPSYAFEYSFPPSVDATSPISGEGVADLTSRTWRYSVRSDPADPNADRSRDGEWIATGSSWFHNSGAGWAPGGIDFTYAGITGILAPLESYDTLVMLAEGVEGGMEQVALVGRETVDGMEADHYRFALNEMPVYGTGQYDVWVSRQGDEISRVIVSIGRDGQPTSRVVFSEIGAPVSIEVP